MPEPFGSMIVVCSSTSVLSLINKDCSGFRLPKVARQARYLLFQVPLSGEMGGSEKRIAAAGECGGSRRTMRRVIYVE